MTNHINRIINLEISYLYRYLQQTKIVFSSKVRLYATQQSAPKKSETTARTYKKTDQEFKVSKKQVAQTLENLLNIKTLDALGIILNKKFFQNASNSVLKKNYAFYLEKGVSRETLTKYPEILTLVDSELRLNELEKLPYDLNELAPLLVISDTNLLSFVRSELKTNNQKRKIDVLSSTLMISPQKACEYIAQKPFLILLSANKIENNIKILKEYGITTENICNDFWILRYSEDLIRTRLDIARENEIDALKTWMVRAQEKAFQTHIKRCSDNKSILGDNSLVEYLSDRLECSVQFANYLILKQPVLKTRSLNKIKELIDFLYARGFKSHHICRVPKILVHNVETTRKRLKLLEEKGLQLDGLSILTKSQSQFMQYYEALIKSKNKTKT